MAGKEGTLNCKLNWHPKFYNNLILFVGSKTLGTFNEVRSILVMSKLFNSNLIDKRVIFFYHYLGCISIYRPLSHLFRSLFFLILKLFNPKNITTILYLIFKSVQICLEEGFKKILVADCYSLLKRQVGVFLLKKAYSFHFFQSINLKKFVYVSHFYFFLKF